MIRGEKTGFGLSFLGGGVWDLDVGIVGGGGVSKVKCGLKQHPPALCVVQEQGRALSSTVQNKTTTGVLGFEVADIPPCPPNSGLGTPGSIPRCIQDSKGS